MMTPERLLVAQHIVREDLADQIAYRATPAVPQGRPARGERIARLAVLSRRIARLLGHAIVAPVRALV